MFKPGNLDSTCPETNNPNSCPASFFSVNNRRYRCCCGCCHAKLGTAAFAIVEAVSVIIHGLRMFVYSPSSLTIKLPTTAASSCCHVKSGTAAFAIVEAVSVIIHALRMFVYSPSSLTIKLPTTAASSLDVTAINTHDSTLLSTMSYDLTALGWCELFFFVAILSTILLLFIGLCADRPYLLYPYLMWRLTEILLSTILIVIFTLTLSGTSIAGEGLWMLAVIEQLFNINQAPTKTRPNLLGRTQTAKNSLLSHAETVHQAVFIITIIGLVMAWIALAVSIWLFTIVLSCYWFLRDKAKFNRLSVVCRVAARFGGDVGTYRAPAVRLASSTWPSGILRASLKRVSEDDGEKDGAYNSERGEEFYNDSNNNINNNDYSKNDNGNNSENSSDDNYPNDNFDADDATLSENNLNGELVSSGPRNIEYATYATSTGKRISFDGQNKYDEPSMSLVFDGKREADIKSRIAEYHRCRGSDASATVTIFENDNVI